jgi:hypothetical protein
MIAAIMAIALSGCAETATTPSTTESSPAAPATPTESTPAPSPAPEEKKEEPAPEGSPEPEKSPEPESKPEGSCGAETEGPGSLCHGEDHKFCSEHPCIPNFPNGTGEVVECNDGEWSHSGGHSGACSSHGGENGKP